MCTTRMHSFHQLKSKPASALIAYINFVSNCSLLHQKHAIEKAIMMENLSVGN